MKKLIIVTVVIVLLAVGLPPVFGMWTESLVRQQVATLNETDPATARVEIVNYDRGWFDSRGLIEIQPVGGADAPAGAIAATPMRVDLDLVHGPVSFVRGFYLGLARMQARPVEGTSPVDFTVEAHTTFGRSMNFSTTVDRFEQQTPSGVASFTGGRAYGTVAGDRLTAGFEAGTLRIADSTVSLVAQGVRGSTDNQWLGARTVSPGVFQITFDRMRIEPDAAALGAVGAPVQAQAFEMANLSVEQSLAIDERLRIVAVTTLAADTLRSGESVTTQPQFQMTLSGIDAAWAERWIEMIQQYQGEPPPEVTRTLVAELMAFGPALSIDTLRFASNARPFEASLALAIDEQAAQSVTTQALLDDPSLWLGLVFGEINATASKALVEEAVAAAIRAQLGMQGMPTSQTAAVAQAGLAIALLTSQGFLQVQGEQYHFNAKLEQGGRLTLNGQPVPLPFP